MSTEWPLTAGKGIDPEFQAWLKEHNFHVGTHSWAAMLALAAAFEADRENGERYREWRLKDG